MVKNIIKGIFIFFGAMFCTFCIFNTIIPNLDGNKDNLIERMYYQRIIVKDVCTAHTAYDSMSTWIRDSEGRKVLVLSTDGKRHKIKKGDYLIGTIYETKEVHKDTIIWIMWIKQYPKINM